MFIWECWCYFTLCYDVLESHLKSSQRFSHGLQISSGLVLYTHWFSRVFWQLIVDEVNGNDLNDPFCYGGHTSCCSISFSGSL